MIHVKLQVKMMKTKRNGPVHKYGPPILSEVKSSQKYFIQMNTQSYHTTVERLKPSWANLSHCVMNLHKICDYLFIDQRIQQQNRC